MLFNQETMTLTRQACECRSCRGTGTQLKALACPQCDGTGKGPRGGRGGCRKCHGHGTHYSPNHTETCSACEGKPEDASYETWCDKAPVEAARSMPMVVVRLNRLNTFNEAYFGHGTLWSCTDYGAANSQTDDELVARVRESLTMPVQAIKIVRGYERDAEVLPLHDILVISVTRDGYAVRAFSDVDINDGFTVYPGITN